METTKPSKQAYALLCLVLILQIAVMVFYATEKEGYHEDELFTYTLSKAYYAGLTHEIPGFF